MSFLKLAVVFTLIMLSFGSQSIYADIIDGTQFYFKNNTSQEYVIHFTTIKNWISTKPDGNDIAIPPGKTVGLYLAARCDHPWAQEDAATNWAVFDKTDPNNGQTQLTFRYVVITNAAFNCAKRMLKVNKRYRLIEWQKYNTIPGPRPSPSTAIPYFKFTIEDRRNTGNYFNFVQEGPIGQGEARQRGWCAGTECPQE